MREDRKLKDCVNNLYEPASKQAAHETSTKKDGRPVGRPELSFFYLSARREHSARAHQSPPSLAGRQTRTGETAWLSSAEG